MKKNLFWSVCKWTLLITVILFISARIYYALTDDFRLSNITQEMPYEAAWNIPSPASEDEKQITTILDQPFFYLGKGAQSYAFASEDGKYVIKFFKFKHLRPFWFVDMLPPISFMKTYKEKQTERKKRKLFGVFLSYKLAYDTDKDESGLIFIQLNTKENIERSVTVVDKIGIKRTIDLSTVPFILQNKGETLKTVLSGLLKKGDIATAKERIDQIIDLYISEYRKGIYDHDHGVMQNTGFVGSKPIHLDVGKLMREEQMRDPSFAKQDLSLVASKINEWVAKHYPQYAKEIAESIDVKITQVS